VKEGLPMSSLAMRLASLTQGSVVVLDALNRIRACEPRLDAESARELDWLEPGALLAALDRASSMRVRQRLLGRRRKEIVVAPVVGGGEVLGFIAVRSTERGLDSVDEDAADSAGLVAAAEFLKERAIEENEIRSRAHLLEDLLEGRVTASAFSTLRPPLGLAAGKLRNTNVPGRPPDLRVLRTFVAVTQEAVERDPAPTVVTVHRNYVVVVWSLSDRSESEVEAHLRVASAKFHRIAPEWKGAFGIGARVEQLVDLADTYNEARLGLEVREELGRPSSVFRVGSLGAYRFILRAALGDHVADFCRSALGRVIEHDLARGGDLIVTFRTYLNQGSSVKATADALGVHPHTVQYRLDRLQQISDLRLARPEERLTLEMALRVADSLSLVNMSSKSP
jgi:sugar diacid utilization regulator